MIFENPNIDPLELPSVGEIEYSQLDPAYPKVSYIGNLIVFGILLVILVSIIFFSDIPFQFEHKVLLLSIWLLWLSFAMWKVQKNYAIQGYAIRQQDILHRKGVFFRTTTVIPYNRVQHCEVRQGPIERFFGLNNLEIYTAGGQSSDLRIPGLGGNQAQQLKEFIIKRTGQHDQK